MKISQTCKLHSQRAWKTKNLKYLGIEMNIEHENELNRRKKVRNQQAMQKMESNPFLIFILILMHLRFLLIKIWMLAKPITISNMISPNCTCKIIEVQKCPTVYFSVGYQIPKAMKSS